MALTINQTQISNSYNQYNRTSDIYKKHSPEKNFQSQNQPSRHIDTVRSMSNQDLKSFLSIDEKKVLKEVFGDLSVDKEVDVLYNSPHAIELLKGSKIDIRL